MAVATRMSTCSLKYDKWYDTHIWITGIGQLASKVVSEAFPPEIYLKFENVLCPFMLLHVNRYAGADLPKICWNWDSAPFERV